MSDESLNDTMLEPENNMVFESNDNMVFEPDYDTMLEPEDDTMLEPEDDMMLEPEADNLDGQTKKVERPGGSPVKEFYEMKLINNLEIIEGLDVQANILGNDHLKEILINFEDKVLQNLREYAQDSSEVSYILFTIDMWTSNNSDPYIRLTLHWINDSFQIKEMIGNISYLPYPHTSECLLNKITKILDSF
ncbi:12044_t:CDS:2 [Cetraspora pellucida]|uniref:12044_t:CDS:1 n=1 Tax=Cetraspora pellucida TaxID=1433469 RepID=A0A9N9HM23_9GLOM|nr:12044_t:CDS:2 [Cetraspora pellucida]